MYCEVKFSEQIHIISNYNRLSWKCLTLSTGEYNSVLHCSKQYSIVKRENYIALKADKLKQKRK